MGIKYNQSRFLYFFIYKDFSTSYLADFTTEIDGVGNIRSETELVGL